jgi:hypothetical protein
LRVLLLGKTFASSQTIFETVYRGRQSFRHHCAYMRMGKVLLGLRVLRRAGLALDRAEVFDYGFGAGTFFRYCTTSAHPSDVEQDPVVCREVSEMLDGRRFRSADLLPTLQWLVVARPFPGTGCASGWAWRRLS